MDEQPQFVFACCQPGAERALKLEVHESWAALRFAFSRPGFVTFKNTGRRLASRFELKSTFARTYGMTIGRVERDQDASTGDCEVEIGRLVDRSADLLNGYHFDHAHVWQRVRPSAEVSELEGDIVQAFGQRLIAALHKRGVIRDSVGINQFARSGQSVLDCVMVEPGQWWIAQHQADATVRCWPGGIPPFAASVEMVSRAYLKMHEALEWSQLPIDVGDRCVELGSAPGGSCQQLLDRGLVVTGIDPSEMAAAVLERPGFVHVRKRAADLKRRQYSPFRWLMADLNVAPQYTLDAVEEIVTHPAVRIHGMLLTLKLLQWELAGQVADYVQRIRSWGYDYVRTRQLYYNRQEICVAALRRRAMRRGRDRRLASNAIDSTD